MKKYQGTKVVQAEPMNELQAVELGYARANVDNHEWRQGYHVVYPDGYESWSPKKVFEESYTCCETVLNRLTIEFKELSEKLRKLEAFIESGKDKELSIAERELLKLQYLSMSAYRRILRLRQGIMVSIEMEKELKEINRQAVKHESKSENTEEEA